MKHLIFYLSLFLFSSCSVSGQVEKVSYKVEQNGKMKEHIFHIPKGYTFKGLSGGYEDEKQYWFSDSSVFYITKEHGLPSLNYNNIRNLEGANAKRMLADTLTLQGTDNNGLYWKDIKQKNFSYGYSKVPHNKKEKFEAIIKELSSN